MKVPVRPAKADSWSCWLAVGTACAEAVLTGIKVVAANAANASFRFTLSILSTDFFLSCKTEARHIDASRLSPDQVGAIKVVYQAVSIKELSASLR